ncbi:hypothetical protein R1sor_026496 [Riccia sorocarpa]|uniref:Uncharacterized protein n=1 Tax=Riccia sorocarpa TaxID=122646 RepID=A0ABD3GBK3_9MARC
MAPFTSRDKRKAKRDPSLGSHKAGELIPIVPPGESSKTKKTKSGPKTTIDERDERKRKNAIIRHAWFKWFASQANLTPMRKFHYTLDVHTRLRKYVTQVPFKWTQELETWLASDEFHNWTNERPAWVFPSTLREPRYMDPIKERARVWQE